MKAARKTVGEEYFHRPERVVGRSNKEGLPYHVRMSWRRGKPEHEIGSGVPVSSLPTDEAVRLGSWID